MNFSQTGSRHWQFIAAFAFIGPAAALWIVKLLAPHATPTAVQAKETAQAFVQPGIISRSLTEAQHRLREEQLRLEVAPFGPAPLRSTEVRPVPVMPEETPVDPESPDPKRLFSLSSIMRTPQGPLAVVNGKVRKPGTSLTDGWTIESIDADAGEVHLRREDGTIGRLSLTRPNKTTPR